MFREGGGMASAGSEQINVNSDGASITQIIDLHVDAALVVEHAGTPFGEFVESPILSLR